MVLILLIFFTSLGSAVAISDNNLSDSSYDVSSDVLVESEDLGVSDVSSGVDESEDLGVSDVSSDVLVESEDLKDSNVNENLIDSDDELIDCDEFLEDSKIVEPSNDDYSFDSAMEISDASLNSKLSENFKVKASKNVLSSADDSSIINNLVISSKSQSSSNLLSSPQTFIIEDASHYDSSVNVYVQNLIDEAAAGSTIQFTGSSYENIYLKISKPLNIISKSGTVIRNVFNIPVFTILEGGSGTNITGFTVNLVGSFVDATHVSNIRISGNKISTKRNAIVFNEVYDSYIKNNVFTEFKTAIDISKSGGIQISKNNITPKDGDNIVGISIKQFSGEKRISILDNNIIGYDRRKQITGIYLGQNATNVLIKGNTIRKWYTGIEFEDSSKSVSILNNTISDNGDGVLIRGWIDNFTFNKNLVTGSSRVGVMFDDDFIGTKNNFTVENNYFASNSAMDLQNKGEQYVDIGKNFAKNRCYRVGMKYGFNIRTRQSGGRLYFSVVDRNGRSIKGLPNFSASVSVDGNSFDVNFIDGVAYVDTGSGSSGNKDYRLNMGGDNRQFEQWGQLDQVNSDDMDYYDRLYNGLLKAIMGYDSNGNSNDNSEGDSNDNTNADYIPDASNDSDPQKNDSNTNSSANSNTVPNTNTNNNSRDTPNNNGSGSSNSQGSGSGDSGVSSGSYSINSNGVMSGSSGSRSNSVSSSSPSSSASPSSSSGPSPSSSVPESASMKTLSVDDETFRVIGVGGLVFLIILVIGLYYREDIKDMME